MDNKDFMILTINDIKDEVKFIETKSEYRFKNLYLKKFCHELKNPLLSILQLTKNFTQVCKSISKESISSLSKKFNISKLTSIISNPSNNLRERNFVFKKSSKSLIDKIYKKTSRNNLSVVGEEIFDQNIEEKKINKNNLFVENHTDNRYSSRHFK